MELSSGLFRSRVGRRILALFFLSALVPVAGVGLWGYLQVGQQLEGQAEGQLRQAAKNTGMTALQRLQMLAAGLQTAGAELAAAGGSVPEAAVRVAASQREMVEGISWVPAAGPARTLLGDPVRPPDVEPEREGRLASGRPLAVVRSGPEGTELLVGRSVSREGPEAGSVWARVDQIRLWGTGTDRWELPDRDTDLCVFTGDGVPVHCTLAADAGVLDGHVASLGGGARSFEWERGDRSQVAGAWSVFLESTFGIPAWTVVLSRPRSAVVAPVTGFRREYVILLAVTLLVVLLLSNVQIRKSLVPLERLREGTRRVAAGDYGTPVEVESEDEFRDLANAFNRMTDRVRRNIQTLTAVGEVDRSILSQLDTEQIVATVLRRAPDLFGARRVRVVVLDAPGREGGWLYDPAPSSGEDDGWERRRFRMDADIGALLGSADGPVDAPPDLELDGAGSGTAPGRTLLVPVRLPEGVAGSLVLELPPEGGLDRDARQAARHLADQLGVALSNAALLEELDQLTWGALTALARSIDAKSAWTAGHSERVTAMAVAVGEEIGLEAESLERLRRGAILHDIGKIGVPAEILDKPGPLDDTEWKRMTDHTIIGVRILEPVAQFEDVIPIVRSHHERWDGDGYPDGLAGEEIPFLARLLSVPDAFDAMTSERPYRSALSVERAVEILGEEAGRQFDPEIAEAMVRLVRRGDLERGLDRDPVEELRGAATWPGGGPRG